MEATRITIASVGLEDTENLFVKSLLKLYADYRGIPWTFRPGVNAEAAVATMAVGDDDDIVLVDIDSDSGRRAWYTLKAMHSGKIAVLTDKPDAVEAEHVIAKPLRAKPLKAFLESVASS